ncbi:MAG: DUF429 domain-containing protein [Bacteroidota bacterium]
MSKTPLGIGIDGCRAGWLVVLFDGKEAQMHLLPQLEAIEQLQLPSLPIWIDMPIGFITDGPEGRLCDKAARQFLRPHRTSSVFTPPCRAAVYASKEEASTVNFILTGKKLSQQSINIIPKMRELDTYLQELDRASAHTWFEAHPEVVFAALNQEQALEHKKKTTAGEEQRLNLLKPFYPTVQGWTKTARQQHLRKDVLPDDIVDALGLAVASFLAQTGKARFTTLPPSPPVDECDFPMQIVYADLL